MANIALAFQPENGINLDDLAGIFAGTTDPTVVGEAAPIGSLYLRTNGTMFQKIGSADTAWMVISQGLGEAVRVSATDTNAGYLNVKLLTSASLTKTVNNPGANETLTLDLANVGTAGTYTQVTTNAKGQVTAGTNPTTLAGYGITNGQPLDATLTALAAYATVGFVAMTSADVFAGRTMTGTANQITVTNGSGAAGNPTFSFPSTTLTFPGTAGVILPRGTTAQRVATTAYTRFNNDTTSLEYYNGTTWVSLVASTGGTVTSVATSAPAQGLTITGGPITTTGTLTFALANDLAAVEGLVTTGFATRTATDTWATWSMTGTTDRITVTNGNGVLGAPTFDIAATYAGQTSITTLGNITTGSWAATAIDTAHGGTGRTSIGTANTLLGVNTTATGLEYKNLVAGSGINIAPVSQQITITNTGVTSITGTANQVIASGATGAVTLSLPQSIGTGSTPTFAQVTLGADPTTAMSAATKQYVDAHSNGLIWVPAIFANGLLDDQLTAPPASPQAHDSYIVATGATGVWTGLAGHLVEYDGVSWVDLGLLPSGTRIGISLESGSTPTGTFAGKANQVVTVTGSYPYTYAYTLPVDGNAVLVSNPSAYDAFHQYTYIAATTEWIEFAGPLTVGAGTGLSYAGTTLNISNVGTAGTYNNVTTNAQGQVISGSNVGYLTDNQTITLGGDITGTGTTSITTALSMTGVAAGTYKSVTVDVKGRVTAATNPTTLAGFGITDAQPLDTFLTALTTAGDGILVRSGNAVLTRAVIAGSTKISVASGDGVAGNPTVDVVEANLSLNNIGGTLSIAKGGTNLTALGTTNQILGVNAAGTALEYKTITAGAGITVTPGANSVTIAAVNSGTVTSVAATGSTGLTVGGSPITSSGTLTFTLGTELQGLSALSAVGLVARTAAGTYASRSVVSGVGTITITNPAGTAGNIGIDLTTVGTAGTYRSVTTDTFGRVTAGTNPTTLAGYGITDAAPLSTPFVTIGAVAGMPNERALTGSTNIVITDGGANSTVTINLADNPILAGTANLRLPVGNTAQRPATAATGDTRFNTDLTVIEYYDGTSWIRVGNQPFVDSKMTQGFIDNTQSALTFTPGTRTVTISPTGASFTYYYSGTRVVKTAPDSVVFPNTNGLWFIYYDANAVLTASAAFYDLQTVVPVAVICWDAANSKFVTVADERHNATMDWSTHLYLHVTNGTKYANGLAIQNYTTSGTGAANADAQIGLSNGTLYDEDLKISIKHSATPTAEFEQVLSSAAKIPVLYRVGTGASNWTVDAATAYPVKQGTARARYNLNTAGTWSTVDAGEGEYFAMWIFGSNGYFEPVMAFMGQRSDASLQTAKDNNTIDLADFGNIPSPETKILYRLIFQASSGYANTPKARLVDVVDMRTVTVLVTSTAGANSHSLLSGLGADDHPQYVHISAPRTIAAVHTFNPVTTTAPFTLGANATGQLVTGLNADTVDGLHASSFQPADSDLTALANTATTGFYVVTGTGTSTTRTILAPAAGITISNGNGVAGNPTLALANDLAGVEGLATTGIAVRTATDTWTTRTLVAGSGISITNADGTAGNITIALTGGGTGTVTSVGLSLPSIFTVTNSPVTTSGTLTGTLATQAANTFFVGPVTGAAAAPTFRTVSIDEMSDVVITSPATNQVIAYNGSNWVNTGAVGANAAGLVGVGQAGAAAWTLVSGSTYRADFAHNLGTTNVVITVFDSSTLAVVVPDLVTCTNTNTVRIQVIGNTRTLKVVVVANGQSIVAGGSTPSSVITAKDGVTVSAAATKLNFTGQAVNVTDGGSGTTNISIGARFSYVANSLDNPSNADFAINALAPTTTDPTYNSLNVRSFSNTVEQGVGFTCSIPPNATQMTFKFRGRAATAPGAASVVQPRLYARQIPNNSAVGAWSAANELANISIPTNAFFQYATQTIALSTLGLTADRLYQFELTRRIAGVTGTNLASAFYLAEIVVEFA